jgi:hypothetical protein
MAALRLAPSVALLTLAAGCGGAASNADWLREPESGAVIGDAPTALAHDAASNTVTSDSSYAVSELEPTAGRQRLDHTVTLGEIIALPPGAAPASQNGGSTTVIVNVNNNMQPAYAPYYGGYGYGYGALARTGGGSRPSPAPHQGGSSPVIPGQSWPAPPSYGPSFPYSTSPASPWEHKH